jgi:O-antigen/teichoic acid export membrane protein
VIALFLGPAGMGIAGLLTSTTNLIGSMTNCGLGTSAVKNISEATASQDRQRANTVVAVFRKLLLLTGLLGTVIVFLLAPLLSKLTFGNADFANAFRWVSVTLFLGQLATGQLVILQGMRKLQNLAKANMVGSLIGLLISLPVYFWLGAKGIVPAIILTSLASVLISYFFSSQIKFEPVKISRALLKAEGTGMLKMGFVFSLNGLIVLLSAYILSIFIARDGGVDEVGLYNAGFAIINTYVGMIFSAMATDYYPRLAAICADNKKSEEMINQQATVSILIMAPILIIFLALINVVILILYTPKFLVINEMMQYIALGMFFKTVTWVMGFMIMAKGNLRLFFFSELFSNIYMLIMNMVLYKFYGLEGIGMSFVISYILATLQTYLIIKIKYGFSFEHSFNQLFIILFLLAVSCFLVMTFLEGIYRYVPAFIIVAIATVFSLYRLDGKMDIRGLVKKRLANRGNTA